MTDPLWRPEELGRPIPDSPHAISVALPPWADVVGYEEKDPRVINAMATGYPRFFIHPRVREVARTLAGEAACLPFPTRRAAEEAVRFIKRQSDQDAVIVAQRGLFGVMTSCEGAEALRAFWQHAGWIVSSRQAEAWLSGQDEAPESNEIRQSLRRRLAELYDCAETDVVLLPTGMAAQWLALKVVQRRAPGRPTVQLGFPYVDTLKLQQKLGAGGRLLHALDRIGEDLVAMVDREPLAACFCEIPGNPLLGSADLRRLTPALRSHGVPLVADDVVATPINVDLRGHADLIATSLTKYIAGTGDVMGGALIVNPHSPYYAELKAHLEAEADEFLWGADAAIIERQIHDFPERMRRHNAHGLLIAERLRAHPAVEKVWYPKWEFSEVYEAVKRSEGGWGSLVTFLPRDASRTSPRLYDRLALCKGPSLGTVFTLVCPFTLLAHYTELDWAESCGVSRYLIRVSVGLEDPDWIWQRLQEALDAACATG